MKKIQIILTAAVFFNLVGCVNSDEYNAPDLSGNCVDIAATKQVSQITSVATSSATQYTGDDIIEAYVTSSDEGGNFYKSISFVSLDNTVGFSMPVDNYNLFNEFEPGRKVSIRMKDRFFNLQNSSTVIGSSFNNGVGRVSGVEYKDIILRSCSDVNEDELVKNFTIAQAKNNQNLNMLIEFNNVQFTDASLGKKYYDPSLPSPGGATNHEITDQFGNKIIVRVSQYARFAGNAVPTLNGKIRGVLTKFGSDFQFMIRTENDVNFTNDRVEVDFAPPIVGNNIQYLGSFNENFESYPTTSPANRQFDKYVNDAAVGTRYWATTTFGGNKYIQMTSFGGTPEANRALFMVPVNMTAANTLSFQTKAGFTNGSVFKVYYTTNYTPGANINTATLIDITSNFSISAGLSSGYPANFTNSGTYNIPASITGNGFFVFEYVGNGTTGLTTTMQIDNIVVN
ncbi:DUF5689 domain-containing protein [Flavobacterium sp.]|uniref:DUF5689 domain-containing protein n=1 Tax=Flavobacterium sp. TaxID=239 RepID=UPI002FDA3B51